MTAHADSTALHVAVRDCKGEEEDCLDIVMELLDFHGSTPALPQTVEWMAL